MLLPLEPTRRVPTPPAEHPRAAKVALASALFPGAGQFWQGRVPTGAVHLITFAAFVLTSFRLEGGWWTLGAWIVNALSAAEAAWWARGSGHDPDPRDTASSEPAEP
jgi:hypothetical protein